jgi:hypothetical protein
VQNPSLLLTLLAAILRPIFRYRLVVDAHNEAIQPFIHRNRVVLWLTRELLGMADLTIVTNTGLAQAVEDQGGKAFVLPDAVPVPPELTLLGAYSQVWTESTRLRVAVIATYAPDEPITEMLEAARQTVDQAEFVFTGNHAKLDLDTHGSPTNVRFTGFLDEAAYWRLLSSADAVMDLTLMDNCLVCGAYEAIAVGKPAILSDNSASKELFGQAAIYSGSTVAEIAAAIQRLAQEHKQMISGVDETARRLRCDWATKASVLLAECRLMTMSES